MKVVKNHFFVRNEMLDRVNMILIVEMVVSCALFSFVMITRTKKNPLLGLHNMPFALQKYVSSLSQYQDIKVLSTRQRIIKKLPALIVLMSLFTGLVYLSGARNFQQGFMNSILLWIVIKLYVVFVLQCGWLAHTPSVWITGTEDKKEWYQDYRFYMKSIPRSLIAGTVVALSLIHI